MSLLAAPEAEGKLSQGVTTEICGNCGLSVFPVSEFNRRHLDEIYKHYGVRITWSDIAGYESVFKSVSPAINIASLCGHNTLRAAVCGYSKKKISTSELFEMKKILNNSLKHGAPGFSTGLLYVPGKFADENEISELLRETAKFAKVHATHLRSEGECLEEAVDEAISITSAGGCGKLHISHLKTAGKENWIKLSSVIKKIENAPQNLSVSADRYPYTESMTNLSAYLPLPFSDMDDVAIAERFSGGSWEEGLRSLEKINHDFWKSMRLVSSGIKEYQIFMGMKFDAISEKAGKSPHLICMELLRDAPSALAASGGMSEENMKKIISLPFVSCGSDESSRNRGYSLGRSHPRGFGSFPKFLNIVKETHSIQEAVRKASFLPASVFGLKGRGLLREGFSADMVLFDPDKLKDNANFANPHLVSDGIEKVWVNGILSWDSGSLTGDRAGRFLKN
jgi:N-acyl-D-amino-acid deacylase